MFRFCLGVILMCCEWGSVVQGIVIATAHGGLWMGCGAQAPCGDPWGHLVTGTM